MNNLEFGWLYNLVTLNYGNYGEVAVAANPRSQDKTQ